jgi:uroporphyrinogen decarboxylase
MTTQALAPVAPDWDGMLRNLRRAGTPARVFYFEHGIADNILTAIAARFALCPGLDPADPTHDHQQRLAVHRFLGHELFRVFPAGARMVVPRGRGGWAEEGRGAITTWAEFEAFPWPRPEDADFSVLDYFERHLPEEMRVFHVVDLWESVRELFGFESFCYALYEQPDLVQAMFDRVGAFIAAIARTLCDYTCFGALYLSDDLGYKTGLMLSPEAIRHYLLPWHQRLAALTHHHDKLFLFHSCGQMYALIDDYIDRVRIDAKHSFEENVLPVTEAKRQFGTRLTLLGGMDVDLLARADLPTIRAKTREILAVCHPGGGYFLGSGNWVTDYIPVENYLAMLEEARRF